MPATDPINPERAPAHLPLERNPRPERRRAALEAAGKDGIIYNATYTNFWEGAMAWSGWWHNQIGLLTEVASVRVASRRPISGGPNWGGHRRAAADEGRAAEAADEAEGAPTRRWPPRAT